MMILQSYGHFYHVCRCITCISRKLSPAIALFPAFLLILAMPVQAGVITFDLLSTNAAMALDDRHEGQLIQGNLAARLRVMALPGNEGLFNQTASRFGINTSTTSEDSASLVDSFNGISEGLFISFSSDIFLEHIVLSLFSPGEEAHISLPGQPFGILQGLDSALDIYDFDSLLLGAGQNILLAHRAGNGFSLSSFSAPQVEVSEPLTALLIPGALSLLIIARRSRRKFAPA